MTLAFLFLGGALGAPAPRVGLAMDAPGGRDSASLETLREEKREARRRLHLTDWKRRMALEDRDVVIGERQAAWEELRRLRREVQDARREERASVT